MDSGSFVVDPDELRKLKITNYMCIALILLLSIMVLQNTLMLLMANSSIELKSLKRGVNPFFLGKRVSEENFVKDCRLQVARLNEDDRQLQNIYRQNIPRV